MSILILRLFFQALQHENTITAADTLNDKVLPVENETWIECVMEKWRVDVFDTYSLELITNKLNRIVALKGGTFARKLKRPVSINEMHCVKSE